MEVEFVMHGGTESLVIQHTTGIQLAENGKEENQRDVRMEY
jgi:hypothetical protein